MKCGMWVITDENQRAIVINGKGMIVNKQDFRSDKLTSSNTPTADEIQELEFILSQPQPKTCLLYTSPSPRDLAQSRMPSSA